MSKVFKLFAAIFLLLLLLAALLFAPIKYKSLHESDFYTAMMAQLDTLNFEVHQPTEQLKIGWSKVNIMPQSPMPLAGYGRRGDYQSVHDSLFVRILSIDNGTFKAYLINADLLLFPPDLKNALEDQLRKESRTCEYMYFGATHTHNGFGGWDNTHLGELLMGSFDEDWINHTADKILEAIDEANEHALPSRISFWEAFAGDFVWNRLSDSYHGVDDYLRGLEVIREDESRALFVTFSAHPTSINSKSLAVSADYPGMLLNKLEKNGYTFAMFMAGAVGSHSKKGFCKGDFELCEEVGEKLAERIHKDMQRGVYYDSVPMTVATIPVLHGPSQLRISKQFHFRNWFLTYLNGPLTADIRLLAMGDIVLIGTSNDFSGEILVRNQIPAFANARGKQIILSSFNGEYTGYITHDDHYHKGKKQEVTILNWVGPYFGAYYTDILKRVIDKIE